MDEFSTHIHIKIADKTSGSSIKLPLPVPLRLLSVSNPFREIWMLGFQLSDFPGPWRMVGLHCACWDKTRTSLIPEMVQITHHHCWQAGDHTAGSAHLKRSAKTPALGQCACCFLARNTDMFLTSQQWDQPTEEKDRRDTLSSSQCKMILLDSNSQPVIKMGGLKALI